MFITVEGPIGAGKTSLTYLIAELFSFYQVHEIVEENPYLSRFYDNQDKWAFQTEMYFLTNRYVQLKLLNEKYLDQGLNVVADYHIDKNLLFAHSTLNKQDFVKFNNIFNILTQDQRKSDLTIFLTASLDTLKHRINLRGRDFEDEIDDQYLVELIAVYENYIEKMRQKNPDAVLVINCDDLDFVNKQIDREHVSTLIAAKINIS